MTLQLREFKTGREVIENAQRTKSYFRELRSPLPRLVPTPRPFLVSRRPGLPPVASVVWISWDEGDAYFAEGLVERPEHSITHIVKLVGAFYEVAMADMLSPRRFKHSTTARQIAMYLARAFTDKSLVEIGRRIGGKDHTTVLHAFQKISALRLSDLKLAAELSQFERELAAG